MVTASRRAYLISPGDILQPWCKAGQGIRLICIADRVRFANSAFMIFRPELYCLWRLDKNRGKKSEEEKERKGGRSQGYANDFHDGFPCPSGRRFKNCLEVEICRDPGLHFYERAEEKGRGSRAANFFYRYNSSRYVWR